MTCDNKKRITALTKRLEVASRNLADERRHCDDLALVMIYAGLDAEARKVLGFARVIAIKCSAGLYLEDCEREYIASSYMK